MRETMIEMRGISKAFPGVQALRDCSLEVYQGEVHALLGENGAGKSTLMKILTGIYQADAGEILFNGRETKITSVLDARALGITMIHQELNLLSNLTIAQNIFIGKEIKHHGVFLDERATSAKAAELLERVNLHVGPNTMVSELTVAQQQMVEIAKAISYNSRVIIMDEPTAPLSNSEIESLFAIIGEMKKSGISIIYISHRMDEIKRIHGIWRPASEKKKTRTLRICWKKIRRTWAAYSFRPRPRGNLCWRCGWRMCGKKRSIRIWHVWKSSSGTRASMFGARTWTM